MILVTGDVVLDHNIYAGLRPDPDCKETIGLIHREELGGAWLTYRFLEELNQVAGTSDGAAAGWQLAFGLGEMTTDALRNWPRAFNFGSVWKLHGEAGKDRCWRMEQHLGYGAIEVADYPAIPAAGVNEYHPRALVIDDGGLGFRSRKSSRCWPPFLSEERRPAGLEWVVLKLSRPLASGDLWANLMRESWRERLIVIVSADQLRSEGLRVAGGLSWETSVDDIVDELQSNRALRSLELCRHLVVTMRSDAALWLDQPRSGAQARCQLVFDRGRCEGEWEAEAAHKYWKAYGFQSAIAASIAWSVCAELERPDADADAREVDLTVALAAGLSATRFLREKGHGTDTSKPEIPFRATAEHMKSEALKYKGDASKRPYAIVEVRCESGVCRIEGPRSNSGHWTILGLVSPWHANQRPPLVSFEPARRVALRGPQKLPGVPCATFGRLQTLDRYEIDALRSIRQLMLMYRDGREEKKPLCLGVFGAPGSGKSFGLKQIAKGVFGPDSPILEFNLSQFRDGDLIGAFHQVRDKRLAGHTPVVFWDEFDSNSHQWLKFFLAPMQDGEFQEGQVTHSVGKAVFVFAGGVSHTFDEFKKPRDEKDFILKKGPDFVSRLAAYLNITGPNPRESAPDSAPDLEYPVRRAMVIRIALDLGDQELQIERGLLTALLAIRRYQNGARSLEKLISYIFDRGGMPLRRAFLPPDDILALLVESVDEFHKLTRKYANFYAQADLLAPVLHEDWLSGLTEEKKKTKENAVPWGQLRPDIVESNVEAALRIPFILELVGLTLEEGTGIAPEIQEILKEKLEVMAAAEHGGWEEQKRIDGWTYSRKPLESALGHNCLIPYDQLPDDVKQYDRNTINKYPVYAKLAGFKIVPKPVDEPPKG